MSTKMSTQAQPGAMASAGWLRGPAPAGRLPEDGSIEELARGPHDPGPAHQRGLLRGVELDVDQQMAGGMLDVEGLARAGWPGQLGTSRPGQQQRGDRADRAEYADRSVRVGRDKGAGADGAAVPGRADQSGLRH